jgi:hypothetical protein
MNGKGRPEGRPQTLAKVSTPSVAQQDELKRELDRRREAALRLPPLESDVRDPMCRRRT